MRLLTFADAAAILNVPESWLRKKAAAREVPFTRLGRHVRFTDDHLRAIVEQGEQRAPLAMPFRATSRRARRGGSIIPGGSSVL
jgi:excisionase family DNA binding protein